MGITKAELEKKRIYNQNRDELKDVAREFETEISTETLKRFIFFTFISFIFYCWDLGFDIYWLIKFYNQGDYLYFGCTLAFLLIPLGITTIRSFLFYNFKRMRKYDTFYDPRYYLPNEEKTCCDWLIKWLLGIVCFIPRYWDTMKYAWKAKRAKEMKNPTNNIYFVAMIWEDLELIQLRQFDCFLESALQLLLNLYIILKGGSFPIGDLSTWRVIISCLVCPVGLSLALVSYDQKISLMKGIKRDNEDQENQLNGIVIKTNTAINFNMEESRQNVIDCYNTINWNKTIILFLANFSFIVARITALSLFSSVYGWIIWPACLFHLIPTFVWHWNENYGFMDSLGLSFLHIFAYLYPVENDSDKRNHPRFSPALYQSICLCENLFLMILWSQSQIKADGTLNLEIVSVLFYPWTEWTFLFPWIVQIVAIILSFLLFQLFKKMRLHINSN